MVRLGLVSMEGETRNNTDREEGGEDEEEDEEEGEVTSSSISLLHLLPLLLFPAYLHLCQTLILSYQLEPAGSKGVWGLDDHFHLGSFTSSFTSHLHPQMMKTMNSISVGGGL